MAIKKLFAVLLCFALILPFAVISFGVEPLSEVRITGLKTNMLEDPAGIEGPPSFSWRMESGTRGQVQTAYRITVARDSGFAEVVWDSGKVIGGLSVGITCEAVLEPSTKYCWQVSVWDKSASEFVSAVANFETGVDGESCLYVLHPGKHHGYHLYTGGAFKQFPGKRERRFSSEPE